MTTNRIAQLAPGVALCAAIAFAAMGLQWIEEHWTGRPWLEALVIAILLGTIVRTLWSPDRRWAPGIGFSAKTLLEIAVMLLGASISFQAVLDAGLGLILGIAVVVVLALGAGLPDAKPKPDHDFAVVDIEVDDKGSGSGTFAPAAKITLNQGAFVVTDYSSELVRLTGVRKVK